MTVTPGLEILAEDRARLTGYGRCGLLVHPASVDRNLTHAVDRLIRGGMNLAALFGPQHGILGQTQDNMIEWEGFLHPRVQVPVHSLYGQVRRPTEEMLKGLDTLVVDLQDVGARYYTFAHTLILAMEACGERGIRVVVLDRPNPLGGEELEGPILRRDHRSFVGLLPVPVRHGLTLGELAEMAVGAYGVRCPELEVISMRGWERPMLFPSTGLPWVLPSPNMPTFETALVYPGICLLEGTRLSEGRGTTRPFELVGAPWLDAPGLADRLDGWGLPGVRFRPTFFEPTFQKHAGRLCQGVQIHGTDPGRFRPFRTGLALLAAAREQAPDRPLWSDPPYEYETEKLPIDILAGSPRVREMIDQAVPPGEMEADWAAELEEFRRLRREYFRY